MGTKPDGVRALEIACRKVTCVLGMCVLSTFQPCAKDLLHTHLLQKRHARHGAVRVVHSLVLEREGSLVALQVLGADI
jgi:hypothetical protein